MPDPVHALCPLDCPDGCSLSVSVDNGRVTSVDGSDRNPLTSGFICAKVRRMPEALYGPDRILHPGVRVGAKGEGAFHDVSWDTALDLVAERLSRVRETRGGEAILPFYYGGSNGFLSQGTMDARLFRRLGASNLARTVCAAPTGAAARGLYGKMAGTAFPDYADAKLIVVWGANPAATHIHLMPHIRAAQARGAKLAVVDPRRTRLAWKSDLHLGLQPGTDLALALGTIKWLFDHGAADTAFLDAHATGAGLLRERADSWNVHKTASVCRVTALEVEKFAALYAESNPAVIRCGWGLERNRNGGSAAAAVLALPAVAGKFGVRGGGYSLSNGSSWGLSAEPAANAPAAPTRTVNMNRLGRVLTGDLEPPVRALFVYDCNPLATMPNQNLVRAGLARDDLFTVVFDSFFTDTARYADVVLPAAAFLERRELAAGYGSYALQDTPAAAVPAGESRTNHAVFLDLVKRLRLDRPGDPESESEASDAIVGAHPSGARLRRELDEGGAAVPDFGDRPVQFVDVFPGTPDRRVHLVPEALDAEAPGGLYAFRHEDDDPRHPLALISPASEKTISSTLGQLRRGGATLGIHPADAVARGIGDGDPVRVFNGLGEARVPARLDADLRIGVVELAKGLWARHTLDGNTANALAPDTLSDLGGGACFNDARVQVERLRADRTV